MPGRKILIAVDASPQAEHAFNWYVEQFMKENDEVLLVHCTEMPYTPVQPLRAEVVDKLMNEAQTESSVTNKKYKALLAQHHLEGRLISEFGHPGHFIVDTANTEKVDCIIIGTRGMGTIRRTILGSVSDHVVHHAHCPVLVCRQ